MKDQAEVIIVASFDDVHKAEKAMFELKMDKRGRVIKFKEAALVKRDEQYKITIKETGELSGGKGVLYGGAIGAIVGLLAGPIGAAVGGAVGAVAGAIAAKKINYGIPDERLMEMARSLHPGKSLILAVAEQRWSELVSVRLEESGGDVTSEKIN